MTVQANAAQMPMPARADEPLGGYVYYNLLPVHQADPAKPLGVVVEDDRFEDGWKLVFGASLEDGNAQFRLDGGTKGGVQLRSRNSGKLVFAVNGQMIQWVRKDEESLADLELVPAGQATVQADAARLASGYGAAILGLLPGVVNADGTLAWPIAPTYKSLVKAGLAVYAEGAIDHLAALQEQALMSAFDPAYVVRIYPCSADGHYLDAGRDDVVRLGAKTADRAVALSLVNLGDGTLVHGDSIALNTVNGRYLTNFAGNMGPVIAIREQRGNWETFRIERVAGEGRLCSGDRVHLAGPEGWYVSAIDGPDKPLSVSLIAPGEIETFIVHGVGASGALRHGQRIGLQAADGRYVSAIDGGGGNVLPSSPHLSGWETFAIERVSVGSTLHYGNKVVIRRPFDGRFASVTAAQGGRSPLLMENGRVDRSSVFTVAGGADGEAVKPGDGFQLRTTDGRHVAIDGDGVLVAEATATTFRAAIVNGSPRLSALGEPADWVKAAATRYATNTSTEFWRQSVLPDSAEWTL